MTDGAPITMSQGYEVLPPKPGQAYPIPCQEWDFLKQKVGALSDRPWLLHTLGSILLGAALSTLITILIGAISTTTYANAVVIAWAVTAVSAVCGAVCLFFADQQNRIQRVQASDVVTQMDLVEQRFDRR